MGSIAVTNALPKTSALLFDYIVPIFGTPCPTVVLPDSNILRLVERSYDIEYVLDGVDVEISIDTEVTYRGPDIDDALGNQFNPILRKTAELLQDAGHPAHPVYDSTSARTDEFKPGNYSVLVAALKGIHIVDENALVWEQVIEFRNDAKARKAYKRFLHWADQIFDGKDRSHVEDEISMRLENYKQAMNTHGIKTILGCLEDILDPKLFAASAGSAYALSVDNPLLGFSVAGFAAAGAIVKIGKHWVDFREKRSGMARDIGYVLEVEKLNSGATTLAV